MARHKKIERRRELDRRRRRRRKRLKLRAKGLLPPANDPTRQKADAAQDETAGKSAEEQPAGVEEKE